MSIAIALFLLDVVLGLVLAHIGIVFLRRIDRSYPRSICWCGYDLNATEDGSPCPECGVRERRAGFVRRPTLAQSIVCITGTILLPLAPYALWLSGREDDPLEYLLASLAVFTAPLLPFQYMLCRAMRRVSTKTYFFVLLAPISVLMALHGFGVYEYIHSTGWPYSSFSLFPYLVFAAPGTGIVFLISAAIAWSRLRYRPE